MGNLRIALHEKITVPDGTYDFDATMRFVLGGLEYLTIVEAKRHSHPIKRELVQILYDKVRNVGANASSSPRRSTVCCGRRSSPS